MPTTILGMNLGPHADFIVAAYATAAAVVALLIVWIAIDHVTQRRRLKKLEALGVTRRGLEAAE
jgi:heme exporter protein D